jgi:DNA-binding transcriptional ArsR family regulator
VDPQELPRPHARVLGPERDAAALKALTHPLRIRLLGLLRQHGPATASELAARLARGGERAVGAALGMSGCGLLLLAVTATSPGPLSQALAVSGFVLFSLGLGAAGPNENELLHRRVPSGQRATALSVQSLVLQLFAFAGGLAVSGLAVGALPRLVGGTALLAGALLWVRRPAPVPAASPAGG